MSSGWRLRMKEITEQEWNLFLEFIERTHSLVGWKPCYQSIKLWKEYKNSKKRRDE